MLGLDPDRVRSSRPQQNVAAALLGVIISITCVSCPRQGRSGHPGSITPGDACEGVHRITLGEGEVLHVHDSPTYAKLILDDPDKLCAFGHDTYSQAWSYVPLAHLAVRFHEKAAKKALKEPHLYRVTVPPQEDSQYAGWSVAHMAVYHHESAALQALEDPAIYSIPISLDVHYERCIQGWSYLLNPGWTVAHFAVRHETAALKALETASLRELRVAGDAPAGAGLTVAHVAVKYHESAALMALENPDIYSLTVPCELGGTHAGFSVARLVKDKVGDAVDIELPEALLDIECPNRDDSMCE